MRWIGMRTFFLEVAIHCTANYDIAPKFFGNFSFSH